MDTLSDLIDRIESEPYYFVGSYWPADASATHPLPFEFDCEFSHDSAAVMAEGTYRAHTGAPQHPFRLRLPFKGVKQHAAYAELTTPQLETLSGTLVFISGAGTALVRSKVGTLSAHATFDDRGLITLIGTLEREGDYYGYSVKGAVASYRATLSNVVGIRAPKR